VDESFRTLIKSYWDSYDGPALVYDLACVSERVTCLKSLEDLYNCKFLFAVKAFTDVRVLSFFAALGLGFDVSNTGELKAVREAYEMVPAVWPPVLSATGPLLADLIKPSGFIPEVAEQDVGNLMLNFDSLDQFQRFTEVNTGPALFGIRIGMDLARELPRSKGNLLTRFGIDVLDHESIRRIASHSHFRGLHCHIGGETNDQESFLEVAAALMKLVEEESLNISYLNLGGGFKDLSSDQVKELIGEIRRVVPDNITLLLEPGGYWFEGAGFAVCKVLAVKRMRRENAARVVVDLSKDCHLRWSEPRLMMLDLEHDGPKEDICFYGSTCYEADLIGCFRVPTHSDGRSLFAPGAMVLFGDVRGYAASWNMTFNGVSKAKVLLYGN
jgi:diaminopimelate decarboxylase